MNLAWLVPAVLAPGVVMAARTLWRERRRKSIRGGIRQLEHFANQRARDERKGSQS